MRLAPFPLLAFASRVFCLMLAGSASVHAGRWVLVSQGDCPGQQVIGSAGEYPEDEHCTAAFAGKTALCFTQVCYPGCQYIDVPTRDCRGGAEMAQVYSCAPEPASAPTDAPGGVPLRAD